MKRCYICLSFCYQNVMRDITEKGAKTSVVIVQTSPTVTMLMTLVWMDVKEVTWDLIARQVLSLNKKNLLNNVIKNVYNDNMHEKKYIHNEFLLKQLNKFQCATIVQEPALRFGYRLRYSVYSCDGKMVKCFLNVVYLYYQSNTHLRIIQSFFFDTDCSFYE